MQQKWPFNITSEQSFPSVDFGFLCLFGKSPGCTGEDFWEVKHLNRKPGKSVAGTQEVTMKGVGPESA